MFPKGSVTEHVINAFSKIEVQDRQVTHLTVPPRAYQALTKELNFNLYINDIPADQIIAHVRRMKKAVDEGSDIDTQSRLWGARIILGSKFKAQSIMDGYSKIETLIPYRCVIGSLDVYVKSRACPVVSQSPNEHVALETLREMLSESDYRKYLKHGFILVPGASGRIYQIHRLKWHTYVYERGTLIAEVCVRLRDKDMPPTDNVIALKTVIESSEDEFFKIGNVYKRAG
jgi:hypothetical protein